MRTLTGASGTSSSSSSLMASSSSSATPVNIGVLALQGAFIEHVKMLNSLPGVHAREVRKAEELEGLDGIVLPGGESTSMGLIAERSGLLEPLRDFVSAKKKPVFATCAGLIMLANKALHEREGGQPLIGGLDALVDRNHFGTQRQSFETDLVTAVTGSTTAPSRAVFIRAPAILKVGEGVEVLAELPADKRPVPGESCIVAARQGHMFVTAFHPELTQDTRWHEAFVADIRKAKSAGSV